jgi:hypothetical protein
VFRKIFIGVIVLGSLSATPALAQRHGPSAVRRGSVVFVGGYFYDSFWGPYPWWTPPLDAYAYYPAYYDSRAALRIEVKPKKAAVYVDGYYAGVVDDFNGFFQRLHVPPGQHELTLYLENYRTVHQHVAVSPGSTYKVHYTMEALAPGEVSEKPPATTPIPAPPSGSYALPRTPLPDQGAPPRRPRPGPPPNGGPSTAPAPGARATAGYGTIAVRVQPGSADVTIDGEPWSSSDAERLVVQVAPGRHHVEVHKSGYRPLSADVDVRAGETTPLNVSLSPE